jgi:hypothetical protein
LRRGWSAEIDYIDKNKCGEEYQRSIALTKLVEQIRDDASLKAYVDDDLLAELFEKTEIGVDFVELI